MPFHPTTIRLLQEQQRDLDAQHKRDVGRLAKLNVESKSLMAQKLRDRLRESIEVIRNLQRLIDFMQGVNELAAQPGQNAPTAAEPDADLTAAMARYSSSHGTGAVYDPADPHDAALVELARAEEPVTVDFGREPNNWAPRYGSRDEDGM